MSRNIVSFLVHGGLVGAAIRRAKANRTVTINKWLVTRPDGTDFDVLAYCEGGADWRVYNGPGRPLGPSVFESEDCLLHWVALQDNKSGKGLSTYTFELDATTGFEVAA